MSSNLKPTFYKDLTNPAIFENSNRQIKYSESTNYWIFKAGNFVYKVKRKIDSNSPLHLEKLFCEHVIKLSQLYSPEIESSLFYVFEKEGHFTISDSLETNEDYFVGLKQKQIQDKFNLLGQIHKNTVSLESLVVLIERLVEFHDKTKPFSIKEYNEADNQERELENLFYQSKKYLGQSITQPLVDLTQRPLKKFVETQKKLFNKRNKTKRIREIHGCFKPKKIFINKEEVFILDNRYTAQKDRVSDVLADLADLLIEFDIYGLKEASDKLRENYKNLAKDKDSEMLLPYYMCMKALKQGLYYSTLAKSAGNQKDLFDSAHNYYKAVADYTKQLKF